MRLDKYLKVTRLIKRRTVAKEAAENGRIMINGKPEKAGCRVAIGDVIEINLGAKPLKIEVLEKSEHIRKEDVDNYYKIIN